jgi:hypothetical protein
MNQNDNSIRYSQPFSTQLGKPNDKLMNGGFQKYDYGKNAYELSGVGINRWENLFFDPQKNAIEPFRRIGENTVLHTLDQHVNECGNK